MLLHIVDQCGNIHTITQPNLMLMIDLFRVMSPMSPSLIVLLLFTSTLQTQADFTTIVVDEKGSNEKSCISGSKGTCKTLGYVLNEISLTSLPTKRVTVIVEYAHTIESVNITYSSELNVTVLGVGQPTVTCEKEGFIHFGAHKFLSVTIKFDGVNFKGCDGFWNGEEGEWKTGFAFVGFESVQFSNVIIEESSDVFLSDNCQVHINHCLFYKNAYHYALISLTATNGYQTFPYYNDSIVTIFHSAFFQNNGLANDFQTPVGTVGAQIDTNHQKLSFAITVSNCSFQENYILYVFNENTNFSQVVEIGVILYSGRINALNITIENSEFQSHQSSFGKIVWTAFYGLQLQQFHFNLAGNVFDENLLSVKGHLVSLYLSNLTWAVPQIIFQFNNITQNIGIGLNVEYSNLTSPGTVLVDNSIFEANYGKAISVNCLQCSANQIPQINISNTYINANAVPLTETGVTVIQGANFFLINSTFQDNIGTALYLSDVQCHPLGFIQFIHNAGKYGGGLAMYGSTDLFADQASVHFLDNLALYGGATYVALTLEDDQGQNICRSFIMENCKFVFSFENNKASSSGDNVYFEGNNFAICMENYLSYCFNITGYGNQTLGFGSSATSIEAMFGDDGTNVLTVFPGQNMIINSSVVDAFGIDSSCIATVFLQCYDQVISCESSGQFIQLEGPTEITLSYSPFASNIKLLAPENIADLQFNSPSLRFQCKYTEQAVLYLNITSCPIGFAYNETACACQCALRGHSGFLCSVPQGMACVAKGYWLGIVNEGNESIPVIAHCQYRYCHRNSNPCPESVGQDASSYVRVGSSENDQCDGDRGGIMCSACRDGASFSFEGILCLDESKCEPWQPYTLLFLVIAFQFILSYSIVIFISFQMIYGVGSLSGPLFYLAAINSLSLSYYQEYYQLKTLVSFFTSVFLLNMEVFGRLQWCFFSSLSSLENYAFHYLGPLIVGVVLISTVFIARKCPKLQQLLHVSPPQAICLLLLLSFWSISDTSIRMLQIVSFPGVKNLRVAIQPGLPYFSGVHIPLAILAITLMVCFVVPSTLFLLLAPFISKKISLYRIQPLLDQFQSCYKDNFRWYPAVYMIGWVIILSANSVVIVVQAVLAIMISMFFILQPYKAQWQNISNTLLLFDIILVDALFHEQNNPYYDYTEQLWVKPLFVFFIYVLVILPLLYIVIGVAWIIAVRMKIIDLLKQKFRSWKFMPESKRNSVYSEQSSTNSPNDSIQIQGSISKRISRQMVQLQESAEEYREPLMVLLPEEEQLTDYGSS